MSHSGSEPSVQVVVVPAGGDRRQIGPQNRAVAALRDRADDIRAAVEEMADLLVTADAARRSESGEWQTTSLQATFGLTLTAEAGVLITKASAEASLEVTITVERKA